MAYYYLGENNQSVGPMGLAAIRKLAESSILKPDVLIREAGSETWRPLSRRKEPAAPAEIPKSAKPPRNAPPPRSAIPPRRYTPPPPTSAAHPSATGGTTASSHPDWFPLASMIVGIVALVSLGVTPLAILLGATALTLGLLGYRTPKPKGRPHAIAGISTGSIALVVSLGTLLFGGGMIGSPGMKYVGSWQNDMSAQFMNLQVDHSLVATFHKDGRFTVVSGEQFSGANYDTGDALTMGGGGRATGYWKWDPARKAVVTRYHGRNHTGYLGAATNDGRSLSLGPFDAGPSSMKAQEEVWVFKPDPDDSNVLIGVHPTMYRHRTIKFYRRD